jgi:hypothetical protein
MSSAWRPLSGMETAQIEDEFIRHGRRHLLER